MKPDSLDQLLSAYSAQPVPTHQNASRADVWNAIARRRQASLWQRITGSLGGTELIARPALAFSALAVAAVIGAIPAARVAQISREGRLARQSIHLEAFSAQSTVFATVLAGPLNRVGTGR